MNYIKLIFALTFILIAFFQFNVSGEEEKELVQISENTQTCIDCHEQYTPGIVEDWFTSRHYKTTPAEGLKKSRLEKRISSTEIPDELKNVNVGCYECHSLNPSRHKDNFEHNGFKINVIVSPNDCKICHKEEVEQYSKSKKAYAYENLELNPVYKKLYESIISVKEIKNGKIVHNKSSDYTKNESCFACHGTKINVDGTKKIETELGIMEVPNLTNWPNQGVGRINPDGSKGSCASCHPRHSFSIEIARKPYTCLQCHLTPDVPAWDVYSESKHGNIFFSKQSEWNWTSVPWKVGKDFTAPVCSVCHNSLITNPAGEIIAQRTHDFGERLWVRLFGLIYAHTQPKTGATYTIKNKDGLPLPVTFNGEEATDYLISKEEAAKRQGVMKNVCKSCHSTNWTDNHFLKLENTIKETNKMTYAATEIMKKAWDLKISDSANPFDDALEQKWIKEWLFYSNSIRYSSAMSGPDYATFKEGWFSLSNNLNEMQDYIKSHGKK